MSNPILNIDSNYTCDSDYSVIMCDCSNNNITVTLPDVAFMNTYYIYVARCDISANSNTLTVVSQADQYINYTLSSYDITNLDNRCFQSNGDVWYALN